MHTVGNHQFDYGTLREKSLEIRAGKTVHLYCWSTTRSSEGKFVTWYERRTTGSNAKYFGKSHVASARRLKSVTDRARRRYESHLSRLNRIPSPQEKDLASYNKEFNLLPAQREFLDRIKTVDRITVDDVDVLVTLLSSVHGVKKPTIKISRGKGGTFYAIDNSIRIGMGSKRCSPTEIVVHEFAHYLTKVVDNEHGHCKAFIHRLFQTVVLVYGDHSKYRWKDEYKTIAKWYNKRFPNVIGSDNSKLSDTPLIQHGAEC